MYHKIGPYFSNNVVPVTTDVIIDGELR